MKYITFRPIILQTQPKNEFSEDLACLKKDSGPNDLLALWDNFGINLYKKPL